MPEGLASPPRLVMFGLYRLGSAVLRRLLADGIAPLLLVTKPDEGQETLELTGLAREAGIEIWQPNAPQPGEWIAKLQPFDPDVTVVAGYHRKIPAEALDLPRYRTLNVHGSLLPQYRGPSTWKHCIAFGESHTGVTIHTMTPELDRGDIWAQKRIAISPDDTGGSLFAKICQAGADLLPDTLRGILDGSLQPVPQDESRASYFSYLGERESILDFTRDAESVSRWIRALSPRPGARTYCRQAEIQVSQVLSMLPSSGHRPGTITDIQNETIRVATGSRDLLLRVDCLDSQLPALQPGNLLGGRS